MLGTYTTTYNCPAARQTNVKLATKYSTDVFLAPGQEFNFDKQIGPADRGPRLAARSRHHRPQPARRRPGRRHLPSLHHHVQRGGGGAAGLKITERHNHSLYISHYPKGRDATVTGGGKNLRFVNDTGHYIWIRGTSTGVMTTITIYGTDDGRTADGQVGGFYNVAGHAQDHDHRPDDGGRQDQIVRERPDRQIAEDHPGRHP